MKKKIFFTFIILVLAFFLIGSVYANEGCCLRTSTTGEYFQYVDELDCATTPEYFEEGILCEDADFQGLEDKGCCIDYGNFECASHYYNVRCNDEELIFENSPSELCSDISLNPNPCLEGCCVVDGNGYYETQMACNNRILNLEDLDFRTELTETECTLIDRMGERGACISDEFFGRCKYRTRENCQGEGMDFRVGKYCSDDSLKPSGVSCIAQDYQECIEGEEDVYWFDSCKNEEGIAEDCQHGSSTCALENNGEYACKDISCNVRINGINIEKENGESWCFYEGLSGNGSDTPGSTSWKQWCYEGEIRNISCGDTSQGRTAVCQEMETQNTGFTNAVCVPNTAENCFLLSSKYFDKINNEELSYNEGISQLGDECEENNCIMMEKEIDEFFGYGMCIPKDSKEKYMTGEDDITDGSLCSIATSTCTVYFVKNVFGRYNCMKNCNCLKEEAFTEMNNLCLAMGDCGMNVNYKGENSGENLSYSPSGKKKLDNAFSEETINEYDAIVAEDSDCGNGCSGQNPENICCDNQGGVKRWEFEINFKWIVIPNALESIIDLIENNNAAPENPLPIVFPPELMEQILGEDYQSLTPEQREQRMIEYYMSNQISLDELIFLNQQEWEKPNLGFWESALRLQGDIFYQMWTFELYNWIMGVGDISRIDIEYQCLDWQAPVKGENCQDCNEGPLPCTEYKCHSLGQACILINSNTDRPECVSSIDNGYAPEIESMESLSEDYSIDDAYANNWNLYSNINSDTECISENTYIEFGANINENAQCRYSWESYSTYNEMPQNYPEGDNNFVTNPVFNIGVGEVVEYLSEEQLGVYYYCIENNGTEEECIAESGIEETDLSLKIRCQDRFGHSSDENSLNFCIKWGPDETPPQVKGFDPEINKIWEFNPGTINLKMYLDENAECRYDYDNKMNYEDLLYNMTLMGKIGNLGWLFNVTLKNSMLGNNQIFIKCKDFSENENINSDILYEYSIRRDITEEDYIRDYGLKIDSVFMEEGGINYPHESNITTGIGPSLILKVQTSRGINNGISVCYLGRASGGENQIFYSDGNGGNSEHTQVYSGLSEGISNIYIRCGDGISEVKTSIRFNLIIDNEPPEMISSSMEGDYLIIITNEEAECSYENDDADFSINEGNSFYETGYTLEHTTGWDPSKRYYIRCVDKYGNKGFVGEIGEGAQEGPIITRISYIGEELTIKTDRKSTCYYNTQECDFDINGESSIQMSSPLTQKHTLTMNSANTYFIKCKDQYDTVNPTCTAVQTFV